MSTVATPRGATFTWNELLTPDVEAARSFYCALLGWSTREERMGPHASYHVFESGGRDVGGMVEIRDPEWQGIAPHWLPYVRVEDVDTAAARVLELGGTVPIPPTSEPCVGRFCLVADPTGARLALIAFEQQ